MCQCSGLLKEKAGYFERLKIFLKVTGLLKIESEDHLRVQLVLFPWQPLGAHGTMVEAEEWEAVVRLRAESVRWRPLRVPLVHFHNIIKYQLSVTEVNIARIAIAVQVLEFWFGHSKCHFFWSENGHFWPKVTKKNGTSSGQIKILRPLL